MKCLLIYYTGTFNTRYLTGLLKDKLVSVGTETEVYEIDPLHNETLDLAGYDLIGLGYPIYGFNAPWPFLKFLKQQTFPKGVKTFIYKNSGETYHANDASSINVVKKLKRDGAVIENEYHFIMPYNIHFRFEEHLVKEMLGMNELLLDILVKEVSEGIPNIKKYRFVHRIVTFFVKLQFIGGDINSIFCRVDHNDCNGCGKCIKECPKQNLYKDKKGRVRFHHHCLMCMRCVMFCPKNAFRYGLFDGWRVNVPYDFKKIRQIENPAPVITPETTGFFKCYIETYETITRRHSELF